MEKYSLFLITLSCSCIFEKWAEFYETKPQFVSFHLVSKGFSEHSNKELTHLVHRLNIPLLKYREIFPYAKSIAPLVIPVENIFMAQTPTSI